MSCPYPRLLTSVSVHVRYKMFHLGILYHLLNDCINFLFRNQVNSYDCYRQFPISYRLICCLTGTIRSVCVCVCSQGLGSDRAKIIIRNNDDKTKDKGARSLARSCLYQMMAACLHSTCSVPNENTLSADNSWFPLDAAHYMCVYTSVCIRSILVFAACFTRTHTTHSPPEILQFKNNNDDCFFFFFFLLFLFAKKKACRVLQRD